MSASAKAFPVVVCNRDPLLFFQSEIPQGVADFGDRRSYIIRSQQFHPQPIDARFRMATCMNPRV